MIRAAAESGPFQATGSPSGRAGSRGVTAGYVGSSDSEFVSHHTMVIHARHVAERAPVGRRRTGGGRHLMLERRSSVATNLIILGLALIAAAILLQLVAWLITVAIPVGVLLVVIGVMWHLTARSRKKQ
jgi:hypothetical protein